MKEGAASYPQTACFIGLKWDMKLGIFTRFPEVAGAAAGLGISFVRTPDHLHVVRYKLLFYNIQLPISFYLQARY